MQFIKNTGKMFTYREDEKLIELVRLHPCLHDPHHVHYKDQVAKEMAWREIVAQMKKRGIVLKKRWKNIRDAYVRRVKRIRSGDLPKNPYPHKWDLTFLKFSFQDDSDSSDIKIQSVGSFTDVGGDAVYNEECMNSDTETNTTALLQFSTVDNSSTPPASSNSEVPLSSKFEKEQSPPLVETILCTGNSHSSTQGNGDNFGERVSAVLGKSSEQNEELLRKIFQQREEDSLDLFFRSVAMSVRNLRPDLIHEAKIRILKLLAELEETAK